MVNKLVPKLEVAVMDGDSIVDTLYLCDKHKNTLCTKQGCSAPLSVPCCIFTHDVKCAVTVPFGQGEKLYCTKNGLTRMDIQEILKRHNVYKGE